MSHRGLVALLLTLAPALVGQAGLDVPLLGERSACAQQQADAVTEVARQRFEEGVKAFDAGRFEDARGAFLQAYALKRHPAVLLNLGLSELRSNHVDDAGNHLQQYLRDHTAATADQKASAEKGIADAKKRSGLLVIAVDATGADVSVDGTLIGKAPVVDPFFVKPGKHTVLATYQGKSATTTVDAKTGIATSASLTLGTAGAAPAPAPAPPPSTPPPATGPAAPAGAPEAQAPPPMAGPPPAPPEQAGPPPDQGTTSHESFFQWYGHHPIAIVGTAVAAVGLGLGLGFTVAAVSASNKADSVTQQIQDHARQYPQPGIDPTNPQPCGSKDTSGHDAPGYASACDTLRSDLNTYHTDVAVAVTGWVLFGVAAIGTTTYAIVGYGGSHKKSDSGLRVPPIQVAPIVTGTQRGLGVVGRF